MTVELTILIRTAYLYTLFNVYKKHINTYFKGKKRHTRSNISFLFILSDRGISAFYDFLLLIFVFYVFQFFRKIYVFMCFICFINLMCFIYFYICVLCDFIFMCFCFFLSKITLICSHWFLFSFFLLFLHFYLSFVRFSFYYPLLFLCGFIKN